MPLVTPRTASRVLLFSAVLAAATAVIVATYGAVRGGPFVPVLFIVLMELGIAAVALLLRGQMLKQYPAETASSPDA